MATTIVEVLARGYLDGITRGLSFEEARRLLGEPWSEEPPHRTTRVMKWGNLVLGFGARGMFMASLYLWRSQQSGFPETLQLDLLGLHGAMTPPEFEQFARHHDLTVHFEERDPWEEGDTCTLASGLGVSFWPDEQGEQRLQQIWLEPLARSTLSLQDAT